MTTIKLPKDIISNGELLAIAGKEYFIKAEEDSENEGMINLVIDSEIEGEELLIEVKKE